MKENPRISIVTPTYNSEEYLEACILSIRNQCYENLEHIIIDGGSTDGTLEIIRKYEHDYPLRWISEPDGGMYDAINKGFSMAAGDILAWLNSDDFYFPWTCEVVAGAFSKKGIEWLSGIPSNTKRMGKSDVTFQLPNLPAVYNSSMIRKGIYDGSRMHFVQQGSCFWSRDLWEKTGGLRADCKLAGYYFLWREFAKYAKLYTINCNLASFRIHAKQMSEEKDRYRGEMRVKEWPAFMKVLMQIYLQLYSLVNYRRYVINIEKLE